MKYFTLIDENLNRTDLFFEAKNDSQAVRKALKRINSAPEFYWEELDDAGLLTLVNCDTEKSLIDPNMGGFAKGLVDENGNFIEDVTL